MDPITIGLYVAAAVVTLNAERRAARAEMQAARNLDRCLTACNVLPAAPTASIDYRKVAEMATDLLRCADDDADMMYDTLDAIKGLTGQARRDIIGLPAGQLHAAADNALVDIARAVNVCLESLDDADDTVGI